MKIWIEFPDSTRFAKSKSDILYSPVYFANEEIKASLKFDDEWQQKYTLSSFPAKITLSGRASLGYLSLGSHPVNALDTRYALPTAGFRTIYKLDMLEMPQTIHLEDDQNLYPFSFTLPTSTLTQMQQLASSIRVISADASCTMDALRVMSPALTVAVNYVLTASVQPPGQPKTEMHQEIRIFVGLSGDQVPFMSPDFLASNPLASIVTTQIIPLSRMSKRRASIPLIRRMSRSSSAVQDDPHIVVDAAPPKPFTFRRTDDAAATKVMLTLTYHDNANGIDDDDDDQPPPPIVASVQWMMKSLTTLTLEPLATIGDPDREDDYFRLRAKILPLRKNKLTWSEWKKTAAVVPSTSASAGDSSHSTLQRQISAAPGMTNSPTRSTTATSTLTSGTIDTLTSVPTNQSMTPAPSSTVDGNASIAGDAPPSVPPPANATSNQSSSTPPKRWTSTVPLWLTLPINPLPSPSFTTSYLTHLYYLSLTLRFNTSSSSSSTSASSSAAALSFSSKTSNVELSIPLQIRYELDMAPGYEVDESLPEYEWGTGPVDEEDRQQDVQAERIERTADETFEPTNRTSANEHLDGLPGYADATTPTGTGATTPVTSHLAHDGPLLMSAGTTSASTNISSTPAHNGTSSQSQVSTSTQWTMLPPDVPVSEVLSTEDDALINTLMRRMRPIGLPASSSAAGPRNPDANDATSGGAAAGGRRRYGRDD